MKKFLLITICLLYGYAGFSQTIFTESFESVWTLPPTLTPVWSGTTTPADNIWHKSSYTTGWTSTSGSYTPAGANSTSASARWHTYDALSGSSGDLISPTIDLSTYTAGSVALNFYHINTSGTDVLNVFVSNDNGSTWSTALAPSPIGISATWTLKTITLPGNSATTKIKFTATGDYGTTDIGIDEIKVFIPVTPNAPPTSFSTASITQTGMTIGWSDNSTNETGFRVYRSTDNVNFTQVGTDIISTSVATTGTTYSQVQTALIPGTPYYYRITAYTDLETIPLTGNATTLSAGNITSIASGNWGDITTWSSGAVPTATDNVIIADGHTVNINVTTPTCLNLTVGQGTSGILTFTNATASTFTVNGSITVAAGGNFNAGSTATIVHIVYIGGNSATSPYASNLTVAGTFDMWLTSTTGRATLTFFGTQNSTISGSGAIDFNNTNILNKGTTTATSTVTPPILDLQSAFTVQGANTLGFLATHTAGTLKISGTFTQTNPLYTSVSYSIPATAGIWLNNANFTISGLAGSPTVTGLFKVSSGTYNIGTVSGNSLGSGTGSVYIIEGGAINVAGRFNLTSTGIYYNQSGGVLSVATIGNTSSATASFGITSSTGTSFIMSGGTIVMVQRATGATLRDWYVVATPTITGGLLQIGNVSTATNYNFSLYGYTPAINIYAGCTAQSIASTPVLYVWGNITINTGSTLNMLTGSLYFMGTTLLNNGAITASSSTGRFDFSYDVTPVAQIYTGTGVWGTSSTQYPGSVGVGNPSGVTLNAPIIAYRANLFTGQFINSNQLTFGSGGATSAFIQRGGSTGNPAGSFDVAPNFNVGTGELGIIYSNATGLTTTGFEIPASRQLKNVTISSADGVTLAGGPLTLSSTGTLTLTSGIFNTSTGNPITINNTATSAVSGGSATTFVNGKLIRTLPQPLATGNTYSFPIGKSEYKPFELVNPIVAAGVPVVIEAEVFDANCGGTPGTNMSALNTDRYWNSSITSGAANFTSTTVRLTEASMTADNGIGQSAALSSAYNLISTATPTTTITSTVLTSLDYFVIGTKDVPMTYTSSAVTQASTSTVLQSSINQSLLRIQIVTTGNSSPVNITKFTVSGNGTTAAGDISNARIWSTGASTTFATTTQFGSTIASPSLSSFDITGTQAMLSGNNYFWLTFDIPLNATLADVVDGECTLLTVGGADYTPTGNPPAGTRTITMNAPTAFTATAVSTSQINLAWTLNSVGQNVMVAVNGSNTFGTPANGTAYAATENLPTAGTVIYNGPASGFNHTLLTSSTPYFYKAWSVDANNYYSSTGPTANATTLCDAISSLPWTEGFEGMSTVGSKILPSCWSYENVVGTNGPFSASVAGSYFGPNSGTKFIYTYYSATTWVYTPPMQLTAGTIYNFSFWMMNKVVTNPVDFLMDVAYGSTNSNSGMNNILATGVVCNNSAYTQFSYSFIPSSTGVYFFGIKTTSTTSTPWYISFDDFSLEEIPAAANTTWAGTTSNNWTTSSNWNNGIPGSGTNVTIPSGLTNYPTIASAVACNNLTLENGATLLGNNFLTVNGTTTLNRDITGNAFHLMSIPVTSSTVGAPFLTGLHDNIWIRSYAEATGNWTNMLNTEALTVGQGYSIWMDIASATATFTGTLNNGNVSPTVTNSGTTGNINYDGWNLVGNPYPSAIKWNIGTWTKTNIDASVAAWSASAGNYVYWNGTSGSLTDGIIPVAQGFFVKATGSPALTIPNDSRVHSNVGYYKNTPADLISLKASSTMNTFTDETFVNFNALATDAYDHQFDAIKLYGDANAPQLFTKLNGAEFAINVLPSSNQNQSIPVGFKAGVDGVYTLHASYIESLNSGMSVYLDDIMLGSRQNLRNNPVYSFHANATDDAMRFKLSFATVGIVDASLTQISVWSAERSLYITNVTGLQGDVQIINTAGQLVYAGKLMGQSTQVYTLNLASATYMVRIITKEGVAVRKVFVK
ncbi:MAG: BNR-repeat neuraminidase N-terminal domain-containing protein [Bacteroidales bacterium]|nr:BNR-repeat neuraminidase N-terminal domain-containing protein [Bacteroidales bacterium]